MNINRKYISYSLLVLLLVIQTAHAENEQASSEESTNWLPSREVLIGASAAIASSIGLYELAKNRNLISKKAYELVSGTINQVSASSSSIEIKDGNAKYYAIGGLGAILLGLTAYRKRTRNSHIELIEEVNDEWYTSDQISSNLHVLLTAHGTLEANKTTDLTLVNVLLRQLNNLKSKIDPDAKGFDNAWDRIRALNDALILLNTQTQED